MMKKLFIIKMYSRTTNTKLKIKYDYQKFYIGLIKSITGELNIIQTKKTKSKEIKPICL